MQRRAFSVAIFARHDGRVLLIKHRRLGTWLPVGGEIEAGETPLEAARRELREETGLEGHFHYALGVQGTPPGLIGYEEHLAGSKGLHMNFAFVADVATDAVVPNDEIDEHRWVKDASEVDCPANVRELCAIARGRVMLAGNDPRLPWTNAAVLTCDRGLAAAQGGRGGRRRAAVSDVARSLRIVVGSMRSRLVRIVLGIAASRT